MWRVQGRVRLTPHGSGTDPGSCDRDSGTEVFAVLVRGSPRSLHKQLAAKQRPLRLRAGDLVAFACWLPDETCGLRVRLCPVASKRSVGKRAHDRNLVKRRLRAALREALVRIPVPRELSGVLEFMVMGVRHTGEVPFGTLVGQLATCLTRALEARCSAKA